MTDHPVTPPPELTRQWIEEDKGGPGWASRIATRAAQWGYDQRGEVNEAKLQKARDHQLEATLAEVSFLTSRAQLLLRRLDPDSRLKPPSLKEQALKAAHIELDPQGRNGSLIIRALEALPDD